MSRFNHSRGRANKLGFDGNGKELRFHKRMDDLYKHSPHFGRGCSDLEESLTHCSVCGFSYDICQLPPPDKMDCYDQRQSPTKLGMIRDGVIGGDSMSDDEKSSYDAHYPASGGVIAEPWTLGM